MSLYTYVCVCCVCELCVWTCFIVLSCFFVFNFQLEIVALMFMAICLNCELPRNPL